MNNNTSRKLDEVVGRAIRDAGFRQQLIDDPKATLQAEGLTEEELASVSGGNLVPLQQVSTILQPPTDVFRRITDIFRDPTLPTASLACYCTEKACNERG